MKQVMNYVGIDVSKDVFDVYHPAHGHFQYANDSKGIRKYMAALDNDAWTVMEATGSYHQNLALSLFEKGFRVSVVNPLQVKRFIQMQLQRNKTDKSDARMLHHYGCYQGVTGMQQWKPEAKVYSESKEILGGIQLLFKQQTALKNKCHSLEHKKGSVVLLRILKRQIRVITKEIQALESSLSTMLTQEEPEMLTQLQSIPGIGKKTATILMAYTGGFRMFGSASQVIAYMGLAPVERRSGSSIRGKSRISKAGDPNVRNHLFMCSFTACVHNPHCKALYERLVAKGKSKKLALIAVCNKLIKQAFAIVQSGLLYDPNYVPKKMVLTE